MDNGIWGRVGHRFEFVVYRFSYDIGSGDVVEMVQIRMDFSLDMLKFSSPSKFPLAVSVWCGGVATREIC